MPVAELLTRIEERDLGDYYMIWPALADRATLDEALPAALREVTRSVDEGFLVFNPDTTFVTGARYTTAEVALSAIDEVDKLHFIQAVAAVPSAEGRQAELETLKQQLRQAQLVASERDDAMDKIVDLCRKRIAGEEKDLTCIAVGSDMTFKL